MQDDGCALRRWEARTSSNLQNRLNKVFLICLIINIYSADVSIYDRIRTKTCFHDKLVVKLRMNS